MKAKSFISIFLLVALAFFVSCDASKVAGLLGKTGSNIFTSVEKTDTSSATETASTATSAVDKENGKLVPATKEEKDSFMASVSDTVAKAAESEEKQAALEKELNKPVDAETKAIMADNIADLNAKLAEAGIGKTIELPEEPTVMNLLALQVTSVIADKAAEANPEDSESIAAVADAALQAVEILSAASKVGKIDVLATALPYISDIIGVSKAISEDQITDDVLKYSKLSLAILDEVVRASDSDGDSYLDAAGLDDSMVTLISKRTAYEAAGKTCWAMYDKGGTRLETFTAMLNDPQNKFSLGNFLDYIACVAVTECEHVFGAPIEQMMTKNATDKMRVFIGNPTKENLLTLLNLDEFSHFEEKIKNLDIEALLDGTAVVETACAMTADVAIDAITDMVKEAIEK